MPQSITQYKCLITSPSDLVEERLKICETVNNWNAIIGSTLGLNIDPVRWETHALPDLHAKPQTVINEQIVKNADFAIALFWSKIGTSTDNYDSGSIEEIEILLKLGKPVLLYFSLKPIPHDKLNPKELARLEEFKESIKCRGLYNEFTNNEELVTKVQLQITATVSKMKLRIGSIPDYPVLNIKIKVSQGFTAEYGIMILMMFVEVNNFSSIPFHMSSVNLQLDDKTTAFFQKNQLTNEYQVQRTIEPGKSYTFGIKKESLMNEKKSLINRFQNVFVKDQIGREYYADSLQTKEVMSKLLKM